MRRLLALLAVLAGACALAPATAGATVFRIGEEYSGVATGSLKIVWATKPVSGTGACSSAVIENGTVNAPLAGAPRFVITRLPGTGLFAATGGGATPKVTYGSTRHSAFEAGCPGVCDDRPAARALAAPPARAADCSAAEKATTIARRCLAQGSWQLHLRGTRHINADVDLIAYVNNDVCRMAPQPEEPTPFRVPLLDESDLGHLGPRGRFIAQNTRSGTCPGVRPVVLTARISCRYTVRVKLTLRRTG